MRLGVKGWLWPAWETAFYPTDMPPEWRLAYFNTQFDCVFLDEEFWRSQPLTELSGWVADCREQFRFLLAGHADEKLPDGLKERSILLTEDDPTLLWFERGTDLKWLANTLQARNSTVTYVVSRDADLAQIERVRTLLDLLGH